jgi:hypothetical protein
MTYDMNNPDPAKSITWVADGDGYRQLTWQEKCEQLEAENRRLQGFARMIRDLSRNEYGRHEGDADFNDPTGISQGNPHIGVGEVFGYSIGGHRRAYARPIRELEGDPEAWIVEATDPAPRSADSVEIVTLHREQRVDVPGDGFLYAEEATGSRITIFVKGRPLVFNTRPGTVTVRYESE